MVDPVKVKVCTKEMWKKIERGRWNNVRDILSSDVGKKVAERTHFNGVTVLSLAVAYDPPADIVSTLIELNPGATKTPGTNGFLPLHVAATSGASKDVIDVLTENYPEGVCAQDDDGKTPLHHFLLAFCGNRIPHERPVSVDSITTMLMAEPKVLEVSDTVNQETPLQLATRLRREEKASGERSASNTKLSLATMKHFVRKRGGCGVDCDTMSHASGGSRFSRRLSKLVPAGRRLSLPADFRGSIALAQL